jgi:hypothetical protein
VPTRPAARGWVVVHPRWHRRFVRRGLFTAADFLDLPGDVVSGHADRHVVRVVFGRGLSRTVAFLKREHRVPWRERLRNLLGGFGWSSKSEREARILAGLRRSGIPAPRWLAHGEDDRGRAFVLIRAIEGAVELRRFLADARTASEPRALARRLGAGLAHIHAAGFHCPDICAKHVLIGPGVSPVLIDWQRSTQYGRVRWALRVRELAAIHATLADELASPRDRLACLRAYLWSALGNRPALRPWVEIVTRRAARLLRRRSVREQRRPPLAGGRQWLRWLDGERLVVTRSMWRALGGRVPTWLTDAAKIPVSRPRETAFAWRGRQVILRLFPPAGRLRRWWNRLRGRHQVAAGPRLGGQLFRQERCGKPTARPLAFGQRSDGGSFVLLLPSDGGRKAARPQAA